MKTHMLLAAAIGALVLSACSSADEKPRKGKYKYEVDLTALELPGLKPEEKEEAEALLKSNFATQIGSEQCLNGTDKNEWQKKAKAISNGLGGRCTKARDASTDSSVELEVKCTGTQLGEINTTIKGAAKSESFSMDINLNLDKLPNGDKGKLDMRISAKRIGDC